jgi:hypothetical protein
MLFTIAQAQTFEINDRVGFDYENFYIENYTSYEGTAFVICHPLDGVVLNNYTWIGVRTPDLFYYGGVVTPIIRTNTGDFIIQLEQAPCLKYLDILPYGID